jgi:NAD(P)-dependent dehydrogenase (short-subunit alcohol dehydrogenase family)
MKNVLVIGGADGIGKGIADELVSRGYTVYIADIKPVEGRYYYVDATNPLSVAECYAKISRQVSSLDLLIITIGAIDQGAITDASPKKWQWMLDINLLATAKIVTTFLPLVKASTEKRILVTGSGSGLGAYEAASQLGLYTISKHAMLGYFKVLRAELATDQIQVSLLLPSAIKGNLAGNSAAMRSAHLGMSYNDALGQQPAGRVLADAATLAPLFVDQLLSGKPVITNDPDLILGKMKKELEEWTVLLA